MMNHYHHAGTLSPDTGWGVGHGWRQRARAGGRQCDGREHAVPRQHGGIAGMGVEARSPKGNTQNHAGLEDAMTAGTNLHAGRRRQAHSREQAMNACRSFIPAGAGLNDLFTGEVNVNRVPVTSVSSALASPESRRPARRTRTRQPAVGGAASLLDAVGGMRDNTSADLLASGQVFGNASDVSASLVRPLSDHPAI